VVSADGLSRRGLLAAGGLALAGAALAGCGQKTDAARLRSDQAVNEDQEARDADALVLRELIAFERRLSSAWTAAALVAHGHARRTARQIAAQEDAHASSLSRQVRALGRHVPTETEVALPADRATLGGALDALERREQQIIAAYLDALPKLTSSQARGIVGGILADEGGHLVALDHLRGRPVSPAPFVVGQA
jgi:hypothetical protein